ncbi:MAG TPA: NAD(P)-dependent oxidoreductase [Longimicrobium sp.]|nr:NAD(P)-dependent oxidoreductase [Longimicrobium sp.]
MRVLITGSSGRVGRAIYVHLARRYQVRGFDASPASTADVVGKLEDVALLRTAMQGVDAVVHVAALHSPHVGLASDEDFWRTNVEGTRRVLDAAASAGIRRLVMTSTTALYGDACARPEGAAWCDEGTPPRPRTIYHRTKLEAERLLREAAGQGGPAVCVLRMSRCFPEPANVMAAFRLHRGVDARDVAAAHRLALERARPGYSVYVVSGATPFQRGDCEGLLRDAPAILATRAPELVAELRARGWPLPASIDRVYDPSLAREELGWTPRHGFRSVLALWDDESSEVLPPRMEGAP